MLQFHVINYDADTITTLRADHRNLYKLACLFVARREELKAAYALEGNPTSCGSLLGHPLLLGAVGVVAVAESHCSHRTSCIVSSVILCVLLHTVAFVRFVRNENLGCRMGPCHQICNCLF